MFSPNLTLPLGILIGNVPLKIADAHPEMSKKQEKHQPSAPAVELPSTSQEHTAAANGSKAKEGEVWVSRSTSAVSSKSFIIDYILSRL